MDEIPRIRKKVHFGGTVHIYWNFGVLMCTRVYSIVELLVAYISNVWCASEFPLR